MLESARRAKRHDLATVDLFTVGVTCTMVAIYAWQTALANFDEVIPMADGQI